MEGEWSDEELRAAVEAYVDMQRRELRGEAFTKKRYYEELADRFGRTEKSFEYRMQNISYVFESQGRHWITGVRPARNVGVNVAARIERFIAEAEGQTLPTSTAFDTRVRTRRKQAPKQPPKGSRKPKSTTATVTQYERDPDVVAWVLNVAQGTCEVCGEPAPFTREDGTPFLEVHHIIRLADGGEDTIRNAVALCPNCHRRLHYGVDKKEWARNVVARIDRLTVTI